MIQLPRTLALAWTFALALGSPRPSKRVEVFIATDRKLPAVATLNSVCFNTDPSQLRFHIVVPEDGEGSAQWPALPNEVWNACENATFEVWPINIVEQAIEDLRGVKPSWSPERKLMDVPHHRSATSWPLAVRVAAWDQDAKHASPFNHVRFYAPELLRERMGIETLIMLDDDGTYARALRDAARRRAPRIPESRRC